MIMAKHIQDAFSNLPISRQRRYQLRHKAAGLCLLCNQPKVNATYCLKHAVARREWSREQIGATARYRSKTYRLQEASNA